MVPTLYLSHNLHTLVDQLIEQFDADPIGPLETRTILVPNAQIKQWLLLEIARRQGIAMGLKIVEINLFFKSSLSPLQVSSLIFQALSESSDLALHAYLNGKNRRLLDLTEQLTSLFFLYRQLDASLFEPGIPPIDWQHAILQKLFVDGERRLEFKAEVDGPIVCFGVDYTPFWNLLFQSPQLSIFLFSPCQEFWEDVCSIRERKQLRRYWKKRGAADLKRVELETYLREAPPLLANWGKLGRQTLKVFDDYPLQVEEIYPEYRSDTLLKKVQNALLHFQNSEKGLVDDSLRVLLTGSSKLKEIECLRDEILRLNVPFHEISVLAPDIESYVPLIAFVFADLIPYRISGVDMAPQSSFRQGLVRLLDLISSRWEAKDLVALLETPAFYRKRGWDEIKLELFRNWIELAHIEWGLNADHRQEELSRTLGSKIYEDTGSWEKGLDELLDALVYLRPMQMSPEPFEEFLTVFLALKEIPLKGEKSLASWADCLEAISHDFLSVDLADEADSAAYQSFRQFIKELREAEGTVPFSFIRKFFLRPCRGQIHSTHLHAVRFSSIEEGGGIPAKALFLIGMDEENFPRTQTGSSLDLLKGKGLDQAERDRYLFLQALFSAQEFLRISYGHFSETEGKAVGPSLLVQELLSVVGDQITAVYSPVPIEPVQQKKMEWPKKGNGRPEGEITIAISELRQLARHPWKFYLQKVKGIFLNEELEDSFALQKGRLVREGLDKPLEASKELPSGPIGEALKLEVAEKVNEWQKKLAEWELEPITIVLRENCREAHWEGSNYIAPALELHWERLTVRLVGEIKQATRKGLISTYDDNVGGLLKVWPEALVSGIVFDIAQIWMLKSKKSKQLINIEKNLKAFIEYYFCCLEAPSPLLTDWADAILRKGEAELEKKIEKGSQFEDPVIDWVLARVDLSAREILEDWESYLKCVFEDLANLYPTRGKVHETV